MAKRVTLFLQVCAVHKEVSSKVEGFCPLKTLQKEHVVPQQTAGDQLPA